jgi:hypothetical protein
MLWLVLADLGLQKHKIKINQGQKRGIYHCDNYRVYLGDHRQIRKSSDKLCSDTLLYQSGRCIGRPLPVFLQLQARKGSSAIR